MRKIFNSPISGSCETMSLLEQQVLESFRKVTEELPGLEIEVDDGLKIVAERMNGDLGVVIKVYGCQLIYK